MIREICTSLAVAFAATSLSGCFFGLLKVQREPSTPPAPVVDATVKTVRLDKASVSRSVPPSAPAATPIEPSNAPAASLPSVVRYSVDAYLPDAAFDAALRAHAKQLKADRNLHLLIKGHGDGRGSVHYNRALAAKRAEMVAKQLLGYGVPTQQLSQAIGDNHDPDSPDLRRVELIYR